MSQVYPLFTEAETLSACEENLLNLKYALMNLKDIHSKEDHSQPGKELRISYVAQKLGNQHLLSLRKIDGNGEVSLDGEYRWTPATAFADTVDPRQACAKDGTLVDILRSVKNTIPHADFDLQVRLKKILEGFEAIGFKPKAE